MSDGKANRIRDWRIWKPVIWLWQKVIRDFILWLVFEIWHFIVLIATGEFLLEWFRWRNGSAVIIARSIWGALGVIGLRIAAVNALDSNKVWFTLNEAYARAQIAESGTWFAAAFAGLYTALYAKFSSQWTYLAGVYNQIKQAECAANCTEDKIAEWKAALVIDADALHLDNNSIFVSLIKGWMKDPKVRAAYDDGVRIANSP